MMFVSSAVCIGVLLLAKTEEAIKVEPGKQSAQSVTVPVGEKSSPRDVTIRYMLFVPTDYTASGKKWPMMLFLHGLGECGNGESELSKVKIHGPAKIVEKRPDFPFVVVTPQHLWPKGYKEGVKYTDAELHAMVDDAWKAEELIKLVDHVEKHLNIDPERIYVTGLSMGGYGTWRLAAAHPEKFAAAVPICGGGEPEKMAKGLSRVPIWAFHGAKDDVVPLKENQSMVDAVRRAGGDVKLTVYPDAGHNSWAATYDNPKVYEWMLEHRRAK